MYDACQLTLTVLAKDKQSRETKGKLTILWTQSVCEFYDARLRLQTPVMWSQQGPVCVCHCWEAGGVRSMVLELFISVRWINQTCLSPLGPLSKSTQPCQTQTVRKHTCIHGHAKICMQKTYTFNVYSSDTALSCIHYSIYSMIMYSFIYHACSVKRIMVSGNSSPPTQYSACKGFASKARINTVSTDLASTQT